MSYNWLLFEKLQIFVIHKQRRCLDHFVLPWNELLLPPNFRRRNPTFFFFVTMSKKKRNHPCFYLMQPHTIFNMKMQCNVFLPHVLLTCRQFQCLKYSVYPSLYWWLIFTIKNQLIIETCSWLHCRTNRVSRTNCPTQYKINMAKSKGKYKISQR